MTFLHRTFWQTWAGVPSWPSTDWECSRCHRCTRISAPGAHLCWAICWQAEERRNGVPTYTLSPDQTLAPASEAFRSSPGRPVPWRLPLRFIRSRFPTTRSDSSCFSLSIKNELMSFRSETAKINDTVHALHDIHTFHYCSVLQINSCHIQHCAW